MRVVSLNQDKGIGPSRKKGAAVHLEAMRRAFASAGHDVVPLDELDVSSVSDSVALCLQQAVLFGESLRESLLLAAPEATEEELWRALKEAGADSFVAELPEGLETPLGANGVGLSGGQKSRLSLARTLLREAQVLIVDEPFAGLDRESARHVAKTLRKLARERIVVVIAHDLEALEAFDHLVYIERGVTLGEGTHEQLVRDHPGYALLTRTIVPEAQPAPAEERPSRAEGAPDVADPFIPVRGSDSEADAGPSPGGTIYGSRW